MVAELPVMRAAVTVSSPQAQQSVARHVPQRSLRAETLSQRMSSRVWVMWKHEAYHVRGDPGCVHLAPHVRGHCRRLIRNSGSAANSPSFILEMMRCVDWVWEVASKLPFAQRDRT